VVQRTAFNQITALSRYLCSEGKVEWFKERLSIKSQPIAHHLKAALGLPEWSLFSDSL
jgi:hypothetical protein